MYIPRTSSGDTTHSAASESIESIIAPAALLGRSRIAGIAGKLYDDPRCGAAETAQIIARHAILSARLLTVANTVSQGAGIPATSLEAATVRMGNDRTKAIVLSYEIGQTLSTLCASSGTFAHAWHEAVLRGCMARALAMNTGAALAGPAYLVGLLQDLGISLNAAVEPDVCATLRLRAEGSPSRLAVLEWQAFNFNHIHVALKLFQAWHLPEAIIEAVGRHHTNPPVGATGERAVRLWQIGYLVGALPFGSGRMVGAESLTLRRLLSTAFQISGAAVSRLLEQTAAEYTDIAEVYRPFAAPSQSVDEMLAPAAEALGVKAFATGLEPVEVPLGEPGDRARMVERFANRTDARDETPPADRLPAFVASGAAI